ncbi:hypothetical protein [Occallatibacter riparius]|uniref:Uncharacterized protein n=1 Tax=Occallatibacter riparius TaxID=1002689 RepID=A0A9J7BLI1_9BACT|nr:hypothetical protein [Occallatibacter riparius]UWZ83616.1 hypothetical protein MOP44_23995 [Occallatibacter riparius]
MTGWASADGHESCDGLQEGQTAPKIRNNQGTSTRPYGTREVYGALTQDKSSRCSDLAWAIVVAHLRRAALSGTDKSVLFQSSALMCCQA